MLAHSFLIKSSSKLLVTRTGIKARMSLISGLWFPWPIYMFLKWDLTLAHWTQVSDRCPLGYLFGYVSEMMVFWETLGRLIQLGYVWSYDATLFILSLGIFRHILNSKISHAKSFKFLWLMFSAMSNKIRFLIRLVPEDKVKCAIPRSACNGLPECEQKLKWNVWMCTNETACSEIIWCLVRMSFALRFAV